MHKIYKNKKYNKNIVDMIDKLLLLCYNCRMVVYCLLL